MPMGNSTSSSVSAGWISKEVVISTCGRSEAATEQYFPSERSIDRPRHRLRRQVAPAQEIRQVDRAEPPRRIRILDAVSAHLQPRQGSMLLSQNRHDGAGGGRGPPPP